MKDEFITEGLVYQFAAYKRGPSISKRQIGEWCGGVAEAVREKIPSVKRLTVCETIDDSPHGCPPFDVFMEVGFASKEELDRAYRKEGLRQLLEAAEESDCILHEQKFIQSAWVEEHIIKLPRPGAIFRHKEGMIRQFGSYKCPPAITKERLMRWWFDHARRGREIGGIQWYTICETIEPSPFLTIPFDAYAEDWFADLGSISRVFHSREWQESAKDGREELGLDRPERVQVVWAVEKSLK